MCVCSDLRDIQWMSRRINTARLGINDIHIKSMMA